MKVGKCVISDRLDKLGISQQDLADLSGMSKQQISDYINNRKKLSLRNAKRIASILKCHIDDLYEWLPDEKDGRT
jgi:transcriptional regulator with XRE-family HTH domain